MRVTRYLIPTTGNAKDDNPILSRVVQEAKAARAAVVVLDRQLKTLQVLRAELDTASLEVAKSITDNPVFSSVRIRTRDVYSQVLGTREDMLETIAALDEYARQLK